MNSRRILSNVVRRDRQMQSSVSPGYDLEYLQIMTTYTEMMSDDLFDKVHDLVYGQVLRIKANNDEDITEA